MRRLKTEILVQMEGIDPSRADRRVLLIGATNRPGELGMAGVCCFMGPDRASCCLLHHVTMCMARPQGQCAIANSTTKPLFAYFC